MRELDYYAGLLTRGKIGRREFMGRAAALGVTTALAGTMASQALKAAEPKQGGRLRVALTGGSTADSLDPATILDAYMIGVSFGQLRNCLTEIAPDGEPDRRTGGGSWDAFGRCRDLDLQDLRQGVEFHNGKTMDFNGRAELDQPSPRRGYQIGGQGHHLADRPTSRPTAQGHRGRLQVAQRRQRRLPVSDERLSSQHLPRERWRRHRLGIRCTGTGGYVARILRARRAHADQAAIRTTGRRAMPTSTRWRPSSSPT